MARHINRLTARTVATISKPGLYADGGGLYLSTKDGGSRWLFIYRWGGKRREMGLGSGRDVPLSRAREMAAVARSMLAEGKSPLDVREAKREEAREAAARQASPLTFGGFAESFIASVEEGWRSDVHRKQWRSSLRDHAKLIIDKPIAEIDTDDLLAILQPIWLTKPETASRVRGRIERILSAAKARGLRSRDSMNPAQWRGHLDVLLPKQPKLTRGHHAAMPYAELQVFIRKLTNRPALAALALRFLILNASRSGEVLGARWREVDDNLWTIPATRMKAGAAHTVTLSPAAMSILAAIGPRDPDSYIFPGRDANRPLSNMSMEMLLRRLGADDFTVHGFRSSFKDWALNCTEFPDELSEEALAHIVGSKVRRAYRRGEALERRRRLMEAWSDFISAAPSLAIVQEAA